MSPKERMLYMIVLDVQVRIMMAGFFMKMLILYLASAA